MRNVVYHAHNNEDQWHMILACAPTAGSARTSAMIDGETHAHNNEVQEEPTRGCHACGQGKEVTPLAALSTNKQHRFQFRFKTRILRVVLNFLCVGAGVSSGYQSCACFLEQIYIQPHRLVAAGCR